MSHLQREQQRVNAKPPSGEHSGGSSPLESLSTDITPQAGAEFCAYDETLLGCARSQWQLGDWESLGNLHKKRLQDHPDRAKLALLAAAGHAQLGNLDKARQFTRLAREWGCRKNLVSQVLIAGVYNNLGRAAAASGQDQRAIRYFETSIAMVTPGADIKLLGQARAMREATKQGLLPQAAGLMGEQLAILKQQGTVDEAHISIFESELELLQHELSLTQQRQQLFAPQKPASGTNALEGSPDWLDNLKKKSVSQLGQDLWVLEKTSYKRGGFFVEFGATDGVLLSNTWLLEKEFGWQGICAEPNPKFFAQLQKNRNCLVSDQYIGRETGMQIEFILADAYGGSQEFSGSDQHRSKREAYRAAGHVKTFTAISLNDFLEKNQAPHKIDYLSVDTEGSEYDLLSVFPFEKWDIRLLTVEHNFSEQRLALRKLLETYGYQCTEQQWDDWYEKVI